MFPQTSIIHREENEEEKKSENVEKLSFNDFGAILATLQRWVASTDESFIIEFELTILDKEFLFLFWATRRITRMDQTQTNREFL